MTRSSLQSKSEFLSPTAFCGCALRSPCRTASNAASAAHRRYTRSRGQVQTASCSASCQGEELRQTPDETMDNPQNSVLADRNTIYTSAAWLCIIQRVNRRE